MVEHFANQELVGSNAPLYSAFDESVLLAEHTATVPSKHCVGVCCEGGGVNHKMAAIHH